jgi:hypothetical protein
MQRSKMVAGLALLALVAAPLSAASSLRAKFGKVYKSKDGVRLELVTLAPESNGKATQMLVRVNGANSEWDGKTQLHEIVEWNDRIDIKMKQGRKDYVTVSVRSGDYTLWLPDKKDGIPVTYDEKLSGELKPDEVIKAYEGAAK